jgi:hypothetical protein
MKAPKPRLCCWHVVSEPCTEPVEDAYFCEKTCTKCGVTKPVTDFAWTVGHGRRRRGARCKVCANAVHRAYMRSTGRTKGGIAQRLGERRPLAERFWAKVRKTDSCWLFEGGKDRYGSIHLGGRTGKGTLAHRFSWELHFGPIPDGLYVCHKCDTPRCVRPDHLFLGTQQDNVADCIAKGRRGPVYRGGPRNPLRGESAPRAKLTWREVHEIRARYIKGVYGCVRLAKEYGVSKTLIESIVAGRIWTEAA